MELSVWSVKGSLRESNPAGRARTLARMAFGRLERADERGRARLKTRESGNEIVRDRNL